MIDLQIGDIVFYHTDSFIGRVIRWVTGHPYSHVAMIVGFDKEVVEATAFNRSSIKTLGDTNFTHLRVLRVKDGLTSKQKQCIVDKRSELIGVPYDYKGIVALFKKIVFRKDLSSVDADITQLWCSELVDYTMNSCGVRLVDSVDNHMVDIEDLHNSPMLEEVGVIIPIHCIKN